MTATATGAAARIAGALWAPRTWRATVHALIGLLLVVITVLLAFLWLAAAISLAMPNTGAPALTAIYAVGAVLGVVPLGWWLASLSTVQRGRFRVVLGVDVTAPRPARPAALAAPPARPGPASVPASQAGAGRLRRDWRSGSIRRQAAYHLLTLVIGPAGGVLVGACWAALLVAVVYPGVPRAARPASRPSPTSPCPRPWLTWPSTPAPAGPTSPSAVPGTGSS